VSIPSDRRTRRVHLFESASHQGERPVAFNASSPCLNTAPGAFADGGFGIYFRTNAVHRSKDPNDTHTHRQA
jgi:hypothetical protein